MATPDWLAGGQSERVIGAGHPLYTNTKDRCGQTINSMLDVEHDAATGLHDARLTGLVIGGDSFSGNGVARTITLDNTGLLPKKVLVWEVATNTDLVTNGGFDSDTAGWTGFQCTLASIAGGQSGNCLELTRTGDTAQYAQTTITQTRARNTLTVWVKSGTSGDEAFHISTSGVTQISGTSSGTWTKYTAEISNSSATLVALYKDTATAGTMLFDTVSVVEDKGQAPIRIDAMTGDKAQPSRYFTNEWAVDIIDNLVVGSFDIEDSCNTNGITNYYMVMGVDTDSVFTGDSGSGSDPDWIESSTSNLIIADDSAVVSSANIANNVESQIWTEFIEEHTAAGIHARTVAGFRIETLSYTGNAADDRDISTAITDLDIKYLCVLRDGLVVASKSESMAGDTTKNEATAAFAANYIQSIGTGTFQVGPGLNANGLTYVYYAIGV